MGYTFKQRKNRKYVNSKIMYFIEYDLESMLLKIGFNDGTIGYFNNVPGDLVDEFGSADSKGSFFYQRLYKAGYKTQIKMV